MLSNTVQFIIYLLYIKHYMAQSLYTSDHHAHVVYVVLFQADALKVKSTQL